MNPIRYFQAYLRFFKAWGETAAGKRTAKWAGLFFTIGIAIYLAYKLTLIGWHKVWQALPVTPWFYIFMLGIFFCLPLFQVVIYRVAWRGHVAAWPLFLALLNKRALDKDVLGYSGEVYLYAWARKHVGQSGKEILLTLKDNVILSSAASTLVAAVLLTIFFVMGRVHLPEKWISPGILLFIISALVLVPLVALMYKFKKTILFLPMKLILLIFGLHISRLLVVQGLQVIQWIVVMPEIPLTNWLTLLAAQIIISRLPLLPSRDLIFLGTGLELSTFISINASAMAGLLLAASVMSKALNLFFFIVVFIITRNRPPFIAMASELANKKDSNAIDGYSASKGY